MKNRILSLLLCAVILCGLGAALPASAAHTHSWTQTVTKAQPGKNGVRVRTCKTCGKQTKTAIPAVKTIALAKKSFVFDGKTKTPAVTVTDKKGNALKKGTDFKVQYAAGRKAIGKYAVKVTLCGSYKGSKTLAFQIIPQTPSKPSAAAAAQSVTLKWKKVKGATGYVLYRYDSASGSYSKLKVTPDTTCTVKALTPATAYRFKLRAYTKTGKGNLWSGYSQALTVKTAKAAAPAPQPTRYKQIQKVLQTGVYSVQLTMEEALQGSYRLQRRGEDYFIRMHLTEDGQTYDADVYYDGAKQKVYGKMMGIWFELDDDEMKGMAKQLDLFRMIDLSDPQKAVAGKATYGGKACETETVTAKDGSVTTFYFSDGALVRLGLSEKGEQTVWCKISGFSGKVGSFEKPKFPIKIRV